MQALLDTHQPLAVLVWQGLHKHAADTLKMAVFAPIPSARVTIATEANPGLLLSVFAAYRRSCHSAFIEPEPEKG